MHVDGPELQISEKVKSIPEALSVYINNIVYSMKNKGYRIKVLSLGEAYFDVPKFSFDEISFEKGYHYSESLGIPELRKRIADYYKEQYSVNIDYNNNLIVSAGSKPLIYMAFQTVLNTDDEVLIHEPAWLSYPEQIKLANGIPKYIPYNCPVSDFAKYFTSKTRMVVICNPNNPAGRVYEKKELESLYAMCREKGIYLLVDEAYSDFVEEGCFCSIGSIADKMDGVIIANSLSKNMGISGWRLGYVIASSEIIYNILKLNQHLITCPATYLSMYVAHYFTEILKVTQPQVKKTVKERKKILDFMDSIGLRYLQGGATFYIFLDIGRYTHSSLEFALYLLLKYHVSVVPGSAYGKSTERFIRIGIGTETVEEIKQCLLLIKRIIDSDEYSEALVNAEMDSLGIRPFV